MIPFKEELMKLHLPKGSYALFGSALLSAYNLREAKDLDIIVTQDLWEKLAKQYADHLKNDPVRIHMGNIEIFKDWMILTHRIEEMIKSADFIEDIPFVRIEYVLAWKRWRGRPKDIKDVQQLEEIERLRGR